MGAVGLSPTNASNRGPPPAAHQWWREWGLATSLIMNLTHRISGPGIEWDVTLGGSPVVPPVLSAHLNGLHQRIVKAAAPTARQLVGVDQPSGAATQRKKHETVKAFAFGPEKQRAQ